MRRREFIKLCAATAAATGAPAIAADARPRFYARAKLVGEGGAPLRARALPVRQNLIFHYPYASTPCFLLNLGRPAAAAARLKTEDGRDYEWRGGVGAARSVVAYSAICAHKLTYPTRDISFISFRAEKSARNKLGEVIHCCSEHSQYDPAQGGRVLAGPAPQPLAAILLEHDAASDELTAVGTLGGEMFDAFFEKYAFRLALEGGGALRRAVSGSAPVTALEDYCRQQVKC
ncbi:MAG: (2Fe-2S)-binding protein [Burkholderiales bacterium]